MSALPDNNLAVTALFKPIIKLCLRRGMRLQSIISTVKEALVQVAREELQGQNAKESVSRISVMTGIYRKEIQNLLDQGGRALPRVSLLSKVIGQWRNHPKFSKPRGTPRPLKSTGKQSEFVELIYSVNKEVNAYAVLFELERVGFIEISQGEAILLVSEMVPEKTTEEAYRLIADDLEDLAEIIPSNLLSGNDIPQLHLKTVYDDVLEDSLPKIRTWLLREGAEFHRKVRDYLSQYDRDLNPVLRGKKGGARVSIGTFSAVPETSNSESNP